METGDLILGPTFKGRWSYAASKIIDEFLALAYYKEKKLPVGIIRLFNTVGPRQTGRYAMVYGDGKQTRTFTHVKDAVWAILKLVGHPRAVGEIFNVGGSKEISIEALAQRVKETLHSSSPIAYIPYDKAYEEGFEDMPKRVPDISKIQNLTGFSPKFGLKDIILDVAQYQKNRRSPFPC